MSFNDKVKMPQKTDTNTIKSKQSCQIPLSNYQTIIQRTRKFPQSITNVDVMVLQKTIGNRGVCQLMQEIGLINDNSKLVQREALHEYEEILQAKFDTTIQREEMPEEEEEEPVQMMKDYKGTALTKGTGWEEIRTTVVTYCGKESSDWLDIAIKLGLTPMKKGDFGHKSKKKKDGSRRANRAYATLRENVRKKAGVPDEYKLTQLKESNLKFRIKKNCE